LGFNPWTRWNVFASVDIGSSSLPQGADFQGRFAAGRNGWFKAFSAQDILQAADTPWTASLGGTFSLIGGSIFNGGVEAGGNVVIKSANIDGDIKSVAGNIVLGDASTAVTVAGDVRAGGTVTKSGGSYVAGVFLAAQSTLALSADLNAVKLWFQSISSAYGALAHTAATVVDYDAHGATIHDPPANVADLHTITVHLVAGVNVIQLTANQIRYASRLVLAGDATGVLIINVPGTTFTPFNNLDVYESSTNDFPTWGRVLLNLWQATTVNITTMSGRFTLLAPLATVTFPQGVIDGNVVVKNLLSGIVNGSPHSGQVNSYPWTPPCPCVDVTFKGRALLGVGDKEDRNMMVQATMLETTSSSTKVSSSSTPSGLHAAAGGAVAMVAAVAVIAVIIVRRKKANPAEPPTPGRLV
jgi:choice-of-anchor A domain-containing protein